MDALLAYLNLSRERAAEDYRHQCLLYALQAPHLKRGARRRPPQLPRILRLYVRRDP